MATEVRLKLKLNYATVQYASLGFNDQRGNGAYELLSSDSDLIVIVDDTVTIPSGLPQGFQCGIMNANALKQSLTPDVVYTTILGTPLANISPDKMVTVGVVTVDDTLLVIGATEV